MLPENTPAPAAPTSAPAATPAPTPTQTAPPPQPSSAPAASGPSGASGVTGTGGQPTPSPLGQAPANNGFAAANSPATQAAIPQQPAVDWQSRFNELQQTVQQQQHLYQLGYQQWQRTQQGGQQQPTPTQTQEPENPFGIPKFDHSMLQFLGRDENGGVIAKPGAPPDLVAKFQQYAEARQKAERDFFDNPMGVLGKHIQSMAEKIAEQRAQTQVQQYQQNQFKQQVVEQNYKTFVEHDASGNPVMQFNPQTGQMTERLSPAGQFYGEKAREAQQRGMQDPRHIHEFAWSQLQLAILMSRQGQQQAAVQGQQQAQQFVQQGVQRLAPTNPATHTPQVTTPQQPATAATLQAKMLAMFHQNGLNDQVVMDQMSSPNNRA